MSAALNLLFLANDMLFPVLFGATAIGICGFVSMLITAFAPQLAEVQSNLPMVIFTVLCVCTLIGTLFIQVRKNEGVQETQN